MNVIRRALRAVGSLFSKRIREERRITREKAQAVQGPRLEIERLKKLSGRELVIEATGIHRGPQGTYFRIQAERYSTRGGVRHKEMGVRTVSLAEIDKLIPEITERVAEGDYESLKRIRKFTQEGYGTSPYGVDVKEGLYYRVQRAVDNRESQIRGYKTHLHRTLDYLSTHFNNQEITTLRGVIDRVNEVIDVSEIEAYNDTSSHVYSSRPCYLLMLLHDELTQDELELFRNNHTECYLGDGSPRPTRY